jgi:iron-sulfur cluster repair protein YtfE (RIC family)
VDSQFAVGVGLMPNVIDLLKQDHREVEGLFARFEGDQQLSIAEEICAELEVHTTAEERFVYPALREDVSGGDELADEAQHEHARARKIIGRIKQTDKPEHLAEVVAELKEAIEHHVGEEEGTVFPKMQSDLNDTELDALGASVQDFKRSN